MHARFHGAEGIMWMWLIKNERAEWIEPQAEAEYGKEELTNSIKTRKNKKLSRVQGAE